MNVPFDEYQDADGYDPEGPLESDLDAADDEGDILPCPACGYEVHEETQKCPYCGAWIIPLAAAGRRRHWVWILAAVLAAVGLIIITIL